MREKPVFHVLLSFDLLVMKTAKIEVLERLSVAFLCVVFMDVLKKAFGIQLLSLLF